MTMRRSTHALLWLALLTVCLEASVRISDLARYSSPISGSAASVDDLLIADSTGLHGRANEQFERYRINNLGYRGPDLDLSVRPSKLVLVMGSSESFGLPESPDMEWPRQLEAILRANCAADVSVINAAFAGVSVPAATQNLRGRITPLQPDAIIYYPQPTGYLFNRAPSPVSPQNPAPLPSFRFRFPERLRSHIKQQIPPRLLTALREQKTSAARSRSEMFSAFPAERLISFERDLTVFVTESQSVSSVTVLVLPQNRFSDTTSARERDWLRAWEKLFPKASASLLLTFYNAGANSVRGVAESLGAHLASPDLGIGEDRSKRFADTVHFTDDGASIVAASVADVLQNTQLCTNPSPSIR